MFTTATKPPAGKNPVNYLQPLTAFLALAALAGVGTLTVLLNPFYQHLALVSLVLLLLGLVKKLAEYGGDTTTGTDVLQRAGRVLRTLAVLVWNKVLKVEPDPKTEDKRNGESMGSDATGQGGNDSSDGGLLITARINSEDESEKRLKAAQHEITRLNDRILDIESKLSAMQTQLSKAQKQATETPASQNRHLNKIMTIESKLSSIKDQAEAAEFTQKEASRCAIEHNERLDNLEQTQRKQKQDFQTLYEVLKDLRECIEIQRLKEATKTKSAISDLHSTINILTKHIHNNIASTDTLRKSHKKLEIAEAQLERQQMNDQIDNHDRLRSLETARHTQFMRLLDQRKYSVDLGYVLSVVLEGSDPHGPIGQVVDEYQLLNQSREQAWYQ